jgi:glycosyltransferase involved in cell wall biosynthesis
MDALFDIILPTHARPHTIGCAIEAVLRQTEPRFRLHVVGDGCDDATATALGAFADPRLHFHRLPKARGYGYANRNHVLAAGDAPFIAYASDDDLWFPDHLELALGALERRSLEAVALRPIHVDFPDALDAHFFAFDWQRLGMASNLLRNWFIGGPVVVHRRRVFERVGYWDERLARFGDRELFNRIRRAVPTAYIDLPTVVRFYAQHWDHHYAALPAPPQRRYLEIVQDEAWRRRMRGASAPGPRSLAVRRRQWRDFLRFALRSGPKLARFWYEARRPASRSADPSPGPALTRGDRPPCLSGVRSTTRAGDDRQGAPGAPAATEGCHHGQ